MSINAARGYGVVASTSEGTKVTKDPEAQKPVPEASGIVTSDSLAAESQKQGGGFNATPSDQPSKGTTTNNTDTSGATELQPAKDRVERDDGERVDEKLGSDDGKGPTYAKGGNATSDSDNSGVKEPNEKSSTSTSTSKDSTTSDAPSYASTVAGHAPHQPKSQTQTQQTTEDTSNTDSKDTKITGDEPNASFTSTIGSKDDPALLAEQKIQASNARSGADAGLPNAASGKIEDDSQFKVLGETSS